MRECEEKLQVMSKEVALICDRCGRRADWKSDVFEAQEFHRINFRGGYGSVFGDETKCECELCQHCLKELVGTAMRYPEECGEG